MSILTNFWVQKRYQRTIDNVWMLFLWGFPALSMLHALETASKKEHTKLKITEEGPKRWLAEDPETSTKYIVEMRDDKPDLQCENTSIRDQTLPIKPDRKPMPVAGSLFKPKQMNLF